ncbi:hypothetical protein HYV31_02255 [candidate division WWE3 bacterium]|nr:hypothetical protein [candidate division WWE3 bacterium]
MTTVVNNPVQNPTPVAVVADNSGSGFMIGVVILVLFLLAVLYFGLPIIREMGPVQVNVPAPQITMPAPQIELPNSIDVNVKPAN